MRDIKQKQARCVGTSAATSRFSFYLFITLFMANLMPLLVAVFFENQFTEFTKVKAPHEAHYFKKAFICALSFVTHICAHLMLQ
jgi:hypothetical protein